jgi:hypothetical protein
VQILTNTEESLSALPFQVASLALCAVDRVEGALAFLIVALHIDFQRERVRISVVAKPLQELLWL